MLRSPSTSTLITFYLKIYSFVVQGDFHFIARECFYCAICLVFEPVVRECASSHPQRKRCKTIHVLYDIALPLEAYMIANDFQRSTFCAHTLHPMDPWRCGDAWLWRAVWLECHFWPFCCNLVSTRVEKKFIKTFQRSANVPEWKWIPELSEPKLSFHLDPLLKSSSP